MKKIFTIILLILLLTGCAKEKSTEATTINKKVKEHKNLIVEKDIANNQTEEDLNNYIKSVKTEVEVLTSKEELTNDEKTTLKNTFITLTDFIFYGGEINGKTFDQLTEEIKQEIISVYEQIDGKIEEKHPGYKEEIKDNAIKTYTDIKEKLTEVKDQIINEYKGSVGEEKYNEQKEQYEQNKEEAKEAIEPVVDEVKEAVKEIYEASKNSFDKWYQEWKEEE